MSDSPKLRLTYISVSGVIEEPPPGPERLTKRAVFAPPSARKRKSVVPTSSATEATMSWVSDIVKRVNWVVKRVSGLKSLVSGREAESWRSRKQDVRGSRERQIELEPSYLCSL